MARTERTRVHLIGDGTRALMVSLPVAEVKHRVEIAIEEGCRWVELPVTGDAIAHLLIERIGPLYAEAAV